MGLKPETDGWLYRKRVTLQHAGIRSTVNWSCIYASEFRVESKASHWVPLEIEAEKKFADRAVLPHHVHSGQI